jgi:TorA maturation chaperone TorD
MPDSPQPRTHRREDLAPLFQAVREDLFLLAFLHDRELGRETLENLREEFCEDFFGLKLRGAEARGALKLFRQGLDDIPVGLDGRTLDILAAEYADIYLNYSLKASPCESVWTDEDGLTMQNAMFQVRKWYRLHGLAVEDWRIRPDDHLVTQLQFAGYLLEAEPGLKRLEETARFLDEHLLRWLGVFADRVSARCRTRIYAGLARMTSAYLDEFREIAAEILDSPRPSAEEIEERMCSRKAADGVEVAAPAPFAAGSAPSW